VSGPSRLRVAVIGAGPAGIMAALEAAGAGARVTLYDTNDAPGRKLLVTGNGRCNISHVGARAADYSCDQAQALETILSRCGHKDVLARLASLGVLTYATPDSWCYPLSDSAVTVADALAAALHLAGVEMRLQTEVRDLRVVPAGLSLVTGSPETPRVFDRAVVATGGKAHPSLGSTGQFYAVLQGLGHRILPVHPALVSIEGDMRRLHRLQGVRLDAGLTLYAGEEMLGHDVGNVMFTQSGLSGPAAMNLSHLVYAAEGRPLTAAIDLLALHGEALERLLADKRAEPWPLAPLLGAVLPAKVPPVLLAVTGLGPDTRLNQLNDARLDAVLAVARDLRIRVTGTRDYAFAQLSSGGVPLAEIEPQGMASRLVPGLHLAGEVLNVLGPCGGYNLLFAQASGILAGRGATCAT
jgi:predicted Rossmann fold flavoprotein